MKYILLFFILFTITYQSNAQYTGPSASADRQMNVEEVLNNARLLQIRDIEVQLRGYITQHIREDYYLFEDASGDLLIEIDREVMPTFPFDDTTEIIMTGEVDFDVLRGTYIWVRNIQRARIE